MLSAVGTEINRIVATGAEKKKADAKPAFSLGARTKVPPQI